MLGCKASMKMSPTEAQCFQGLPDLTWHKHYFTHHQHPFKAYLWQILHFAADLHDLQ